VQRGWFIHPRVKVLAADDAFQAEDHIPGQYLDDNVTLDVMSVCHAGETVIPLTRVIPCAATSLKW
jgi:hypothetical protein